MFYRFYIELNQPKSFAARDYIHHNLDDPHSQANLQDDKLPDFEPNFGVLHLTRDSSLVDFVADGSATGGLGLLVSKKALGVLETLTLPPHRAYPLHATLAGKGINDFYYWLQILAAPYSDWIDFSQSKFQLKSQFEMDEDVKGDDVKIQSAGELEAVIETLGENDQDLLFSKIVLNEKYTEVGYDIFYFERLDGVRARYPYVTTKFKEAMEQAKLVGYNLKRVPTIIAP